MDEPLEYEEFIELIRLGRVLLMEEPTQLEKNAIYFNDPVRLISHFADSEDAARAYVHCMTGIDFMFLRKN